VFLELCLATALALYAVPFETLFPLLDYLDTCKFPLRIPLSLSLSELLALEIIACLVWYQPSFFVDSIEFISLQTSLISQIDWKSKIETIYNVSISIGLHICHLFSTSYSLIPRIPNRAGLV
jgi:hypothetical protein